MQIKRHMQYCVHHIECIVYQREYRRFYYAYPFMPSHNLSNGTEWMAHNYCLEVMEVSFCFKKFITRTKTSYVLNGIRSFHLQNIKINFID